MVYINIRMSPGLPIPGYMQSRNNTWILCARTGDNRAHNISWAHGVFMGYSIEHLV